MLLLICRINAVVTKAFTPPLLEKEGVATFCA